MSLAETFKKPFQKFENYYNNASPSVQQGINVGAEAVGGLLQKGLSFGNNKGTGVGNAIGTLGNAAANFLPGPWGAVAKVGAGFLGGLTNGLFGYKLNDENVQAVQDNINNANRFNITAQNWDDFSNQISRAPATMAFRNSFIGKDSLFNKGATKKTNQLLAAQDNAISWVNRSTSNAASNISTNEALTANSKAFAEGGALNMTPITNPYSKRSLLNYLNLLYGSNRFDDGGNIYHNGIDFNEWLTEINTGGTHEENPYEGVGYGVDPQGTPNLVEEGEVVNNETNYVFTNRFGPDNEKGPTFADMAKKINDKIEKRPFDRITKRSVERELADLEQLQEEVKMERNAEQFKEEVAQMSPEEIMQLQQMLMANEQMPGFDQIQDPYAAQQDPYAGQDMAMQGMPEDVGNPYAAPQMMANGGRVNKFADGSTLLKFDFNQPTFNSVANDAILSLLNKEPYGAQQAKAKINAANQGEKAWENPTLWPSKDYTQPQYGFNVDFSLSGNSPKKVKVSSDNALPTWGRYAGAAGNFASALMSLFDKPYYANTERAEKAAAGVPYVSAKKLGNYATYTPFDVNYAMAVNNANTAAAMRAAVANSGGNRALANASIMAAERTAQQNNANALQQAAQVNYSNYLQALKHNAGIEEANVRNQLAVDQANQNRDANFAQFLFNTGRLRDAELAATQAARNTAFQRFLSDFSNIGKENFIFNQLNSNRALDYALKNNGYSWFKGEDR